MYSLRCLAASVTLVLWNEACSRPEAVPVEQQGSAQTPPVAVRGLMPGELVEARAALESVYASHFANGQRTGDDSAKTWYTTALNQLMREDAAGGAAQCGVGFLNFDPLTSAQDDVGSYMLGEPRSQADTALIPVRIHTDYPAPKGTDEAMTVAVVRETGRWRIANFVHTDWDLLSSLRTSVAELRVAPKVNCSTPPAEAPDSLRRDSASKSPS
jgi:hypothetical protein